MSIRELEIAEPIRGPIDVDEYDGVLIPNVKFPTAFSLGQLEGNGKTFKTKYLKERWHWFNNHCFGGVMKEPDVWEITKAFKDIKLFGSWTSSSRRIKMHPKLWELKDERQCLGTLLHEMAHQYVFEHEPWAAHEDSHGPSWQNAMIRLGMSKAAKWRGKQEDLQGQKERKVVERFQSTAPRANRTTFKDAFNYGVLVNTVKGRETPLVIVGPNWFREPEQGFNGVYVPGFSVKEIGMSIFKWYNLEQLYKPDLIEVEDFPAELKGEAAKRKVRHIVLTLEAQHQRKAELQDLLLQMKSNDKTE